MSPVDRQQAEENLAKLKRPIVPPELLVSQKEEKEDQQRARELWLEVMAEFHQQRGIRHDQTTSRSSGKGFLDLPAEIRIMIYEFYLRFEKKVQQYRWRARFQCSECKARSEWLASLPRAKRDQIGRNNKARSSGPCPECVGRDVEEGYRYTLDQLECQTRHQKMLQSISKRAYDDLIKADPRAHTLRGPFKQYKYQYNARVDRCYHEEHHDTDIVRINERGSLCDDLPSLALSCRKVLREMWGVIYQNPRYEITVQNMDLFPALRFLDMLRARNIAHVDGKMVEIDFREVVPSKDAPSHIREQDKQKFGKIRRLISMHWIDDLPLWSTLTGHGPEVINWAEPELRDQLEEDGLVDSREALEKWLYCVRQVVALYRIDHSLWRLHSERLLQLADLLTDSGFAETYDMQWVVEDSQDADLMDGVCGMISSAIEYSLGYIGNFEETSNDPDDEEVEKGKYDFFRYRGEYEQIAYEPQHMEVLIVRKYCAAIDTILRDKLGEFYEEWEMMEDDRVLPKGLVL
jgi:hypothetical protein